MNKLMLQRMGKVNSAERLSLILLTFPTSGLWAIASGPLHRRNTP